jgi:GAF domain-containing protein
MPRADLEMRCPECGVPSAVPIDAPGRVPVAPDRRVDELLRLTRELLDCDIALLTDVRDGRETVRRASGSWPGGPLENASVALTDTFCQQMLEGRIGHYIRDARADDRVRDLAMARHLGIRAWLGVPIRLSDVQLYVLCCLAREARPDLGEREVRLLLGLAESVRAQLQPELDTSE